MADSAVVICNMAISHLGQGKTIAALDERSQEAIACNLFYSEARDKALRDFDWSFARRVQALSLIEELTADTDEWYYRYGMPSGCLKFLRIQSPYRTDARDSRVSYQIKNVADVKCIYTDREDAIGEFTVRVEDTTLYPPDFTLALSYLLAYYIAPRFAAGSTKLKKEMLEQYQFESSQAMANAANEEQPDEAPDGEFIRARMSSDGEDT